MRWLLPWTLVAVAAAAAAGSTLATVSPAPRGTVPTGSAVRVGGMRRAAMWGGGQGSVR